jgi:hypothetical protein
MSTLNYTVVPMKVVRRGHICHWAFFNFNRPGSFNLWWAKNTIEGLEEQYDGKIKGDESESDEEIEVKTTITTRSEADAPTMTPSEEWELGFCCI